jgi:outer membrane lipoprotein-sorting protein
MLVVIVCLLTVHSGLAQEAEKIVKKMYDTYESIDQICAEYTQTFRWKLADEVHTVKGNICAKDDDKFRVETDKQIIATNGKTLWTLSKPNQQVIIDRGENKESKYPVLKSFIENYRNNYIPEYIDKETVQGKKCHHLKLMAKTDDQFNRTIDIWVDEDTWFMLKALQTDINGNESIYEIYNMNTDPDLKNDYFTLEIPEGMEVVDMR